MIALKILTQIAFGLSSIFLILTFIFKENTSLYLIWTFLIACWCVLEIISYFKIKTEKRKFPISYFVLILFIGLWAYLSFF